MTLATSLPAQPATETGLAAPTAAEREDARQGLADGALPAYRAILKNGGPTALVIDAIVELGRNKATTDIALIARQVSALDPNISTTAVEALKGYGRAGLKAVQALDASLIDAKTRKQAVDLLLLEHVRNSCRRDMQVNPFRFDYAGRFDELDSTGVPLDEMLLRLLRESLPDIRSDLDGSRYRYYGYSPYRTEQPFVDYGGLAVAALAKRQPAQLEREMAEVSRLQIAENYWYGGVNVRTPVTCELAVFFARRGQAGLLDRVINDMSSVMRWNDSPYYANIHLQIAALQAAGLGETDAALERVATAISMLGTRTQGYEAAVAGAHYLRARLLMARGEEGAALSSLEDAMDSSDRPPVIALVDDAFGALAAERRYKDVIRFCELRQRVLPVSARPWRKEMQEPEPDSEPDAAVDEDE